MFLYIYIIYSNMCYFTQLKKLTELYRFEHNNRINKREYLNIIFYI